MNLQMRHLVRQTPDGIAMKLLTRYLVRRVLGGIGVTLLAVVAVLTLVDFIDEARRVRAGGYSFAEVLWVIVLTTPQRMYEVLPVSVFIGSLLSLGQLAADNEMTAMRASGLGIWRVTRPLLLLGLLLALATILIGEKLAPPGMEAAWSLKRQYRGPGADDAGLWIRKDGSYMRVQRARDPGRLSDVLAYRIGVDGVLQRSAHARSAWFDGEHWVLQDVRESVVHPDGTMQTQQHAELVETALPPADVLELVMRPADEMSMASLSRYLDFFAGEQVELRPYRFAWWQRFITPISCVAVLLLTVPFAFVQPRGGGLGQRIFIGVLSGIGIYLFNRLCAHLGLVLGLPPWQAASLPLLLLLALGALLLSNRRISTV